MSYCDVEPVECYTERRPVSRGVVKCDDCRRVIPKGVKYLSAKWLYDGHWDGVACCPDCDAVVVYLRKRGADCLYRGQLREWFFELSPGDFRAGACYADVPRASPVVTDTFATWARHYDIDPVTLEQKGPA